MVMKSDPQIGVSVDTGDRLVGAGCKDSNGKYQVPNLDADGNLLVSVGGASSGDGAILDGADTAIRATVKDLTSSNPLTVAIVDASGDQITSFGSPSDHTATGTLNAVDEAVEITSLSGDGSVGIQVTGTFDATLRFEGSIDGTNYAAVYCINIASGFASQTTASASIFQSDISGFLKFRVRCSVYASGDAVVTIISRPGVPVSGLNLYNLSGYLATIAGWDFFTGAYVNPIRSQQGVSGGSGTVDGKTQRVILATDVPLPAGTNAIGKLSANSGVDIGDVDVTSLPSIPAGSNVIGHVIADTGSTTAVTGNVTVVQPTGTNLHVVTDSGTITTVSTVSAVTAVGTITPGTAASSLGKAEDAIHGSGDVGVFSLGVANEAQTSLAADGDYIAQATDTKGNGIVVGNIAHDGADAGAPIKIGAKAASAEPAVVANNDRANLYTDLAGKLVVLPYANPENFVSGCISSAMTGTTSTSLIAAPASGLRNYITQITVSNSHATVGTDILIQDGNGGTTLYVIPAASVYGGATLTFPTPLRQPTTATAIYCANVTTGSSTKVSASGYKGA